MKAIRPHLGKLLTTNEKEVGRARDHEDPRCRAHVFLQFRIHHIVGCFSIPPCGVHAGFGGGGP